MKIRTLVIVGGAIVAAMLVLSAWAWPQIPDGAQVPIHWGPDGQADGFGPKWVALLGLPATAVGIIALLALIPRIEPRRQNLERSATAYVAIGIAVVAFLGVLHVVSVMSVLGSEINITSVAMIGAGTMFMVMGNFIGKTRSNWFFGIRTPWTLSSDRSWTLTHRAGGWVFIGIGLLTILSTLMIGGELAVWIMLVGLLGGTIGLFAYSYVVWRGDPNRIETGRKEASS